MSDEVLGAVVALIATIVSKTLVELFSTRVLKNELREIRDALRPVVDRVDAVEAAAEEHAVRLDTLENVVFR